MRRLLPIGATAGFLAWAAVAWAAVYAPPPDVASLSSTVASLSTTVAGILVKIPVGTSTLVATDYVSTCDVLVDTTTTTSVFCPGSAAARTVPGNAWFVGRQWAVDGDDQYVDLAGTVPDPGSTGAVRYLSIDFTQAGALTPAVTMRKIQIETTIGTGRVIRSSKSYTVQASAGQGPRLAVQADSWGIGKGASVTLNSSARIMADWLGLPLAGINALDGTGIIGASGGTAPNGTQDYKSRIPDLLQLAPDIIVVQNFTNDYYAINNGTLTLANFATYVGQYLTALRAAFPATPIVLVTGALGDETQATYTNAEDAIVAAVAAMQAGGDTRIAAVRAIKPANSGRSWLYGTGNTGATTGDGNRDLYIGTVAAQHPNDAGHAYYGRREAAEVYAAIQAMQ